MAYLVPSLEISFRLPYARVLSDESVQEALVSLPVHATPQVLRLTVANMLKRYLFPKIDWRNRFVCLKGGKGKTFRQIKDTPNSFIAYDDVEMALATKSHFGSSDSSIDAIRLFASITRPRFFCLLHITFDGFLI